MSGTWVVRNKNRGNEKEVDSRAEAEERKSDIVSLGASPEDIEIIPPTEDVEPDVVDQTKDTAADGGAEVVEGEAAPDDVEQAMEEDPDIITSVDDLQQAQESAVPDKAGVDQDPLDILPGYMIDTVQGKPTLNKRGLSVLAFHYGVSIEDREIVVSPHESDWEYAIVETTVTNEEGNTFVGTGTAHVDRGDEKEVILELAETRSYKRAVSFATGTGIVSYQEMVGELE